MHQPPFPLTLNNKYSKCLDLDERAIYVISGQVPNVRGR